MKNDILFIRKCIENLYRNFYENAEIYFCESDLQSELFALLLKYFGDEEEISNVFNWGPSKNKPIRNVNTRRLHSELLLPEGRIDLAVLDLKKIFFAINSKGRNPGFRIEEGNHIFVEIKASRTNRSAVTSKNTWYKLILSDIEKLNRYSHKCFLLCFDFNTLLDKGRISSLHEKVKRNTELLYFQNNKSVNYFIE